MPTARSEKLNPRGSKAPYSVTMTTGSAAMAVVVIPSGHMSTILDTPLAVAAFRAIIGTPPQTAASGIGFLAGQYRGFVDGFWIVKSGAL